ncbi:MULTISPECIES: hypothetical protein [unclassified Archaeoglobus]|jgi:HD superfamily phosphohydrolase|uniref:hypothetical protein n=1 Tax=unclassified Archaeoglobus TaxID=2643606 RepID=UPI0025C035A9|nr:MULTISPECIES: hypothetical protein [unclassified Archaeoglobus]
MFNQIYFHPIRRCYDALLDRYLSKILPDGYPEDLEEYLNLDDVYILNLIRRDVKSKNVEDSERKRLAESIYKRNHPRLVFEHSIDLTEDDFDEVCKNSIRTQAAFQFELSNIIDLNSIAPTTIYANANHLSNPFLDFYVAYTVIN